MTRCRSLTYEPYRSGSATGVLAPKAIILGNPDLTLYKHFGSAFSAIVPMAAPCPPIVKAIDPRGHFATVLRADSWHVVMQLNDITDTATKFEQCPVACLGGHMVKHYKNKRLASLCDLHRGPLVRDHSSNVFTALPRDLVTPLYVVYVGDSQYGTVPELSTALSTGWPRQWKTLVKGHIFTTSAVDAMHVKAPAAQSGDTLLTCAGCNSAGWHAASSNQRMLAMHLRISHGVRNPIKQFIGADARCPACEARFSTRLRAIAHATEKRKRGNSTRPTCFEQLSAGRFPAVPAEVLLQLEQADAAARLQAQRVGLSQPRSIAPAVRAKRRSSACTCLPQRCLPRKRLREKTLICAACAPASARPAPATPVGAALAPPVACVCGAPSQKRRRLHTKTTPCCPRRNRDAAADLCMPHPQPPAPLKRARLSVPLPAADLPV